MQGYEGYDEFDEFDDFENEETFTQPPHRDDRLWRHPSEMHRAPAPPPSPSTAGDTPEGPPARFTPDFVPEPFVELIPTGEQLVLVPAGPDPDNGAGRRRAFALASTALLGLLVLGGMQLQSARDSVPSASAVSTPTPNPGTATADWSSRQQGSTDQPTGETDATSQGLSLASSIEERHAKNQPQSSSTALGGFDLPLSWTAELQERLVGVISGVEVVVNGTAIPGYGIVFDNAGHVVTSARLVRNASHIIVHTDDLRHEARVVGFDVKTDVAVLHVGHPMPVATLNPTAEQWSGRFVLAPDSTDAQLTTTQILHQDGQASWSSTDRIYGLFQLEMAASDLAAGAPLIDDLGQIVGMSVFPSPEAGTASAVPAAVIARVADSLIATGSVHHPWLGLEVRDSAAGQTRGAEVVTVFAGSPAEELALTAGDVVVSFNGQSIMSMGNLVSNIQRRNPGDAVAISWLRDGVAHAGTVALSSDED